MANRVFDAFLPVETNRNGEKKTRWVRLGSMFKKEDNKLYMTVDPTINLAAFPHEPGGSLFVSFFPPRDNRNDQGQAGNGNNGGGNINPVNANGDPNGLFGNSGEDSSVPF